MGTFFRFLKILAKKYLLRKRTVAVSLVLFHLSSGFGGLIQAETGRSPHPTQTIFNLTADEVRIDSVIPRFFYSYPVGRGYADSTYTVSIEYPEFIDMGTADIARMKKLMERDGAGLQAMPVVESYVGASRRQGTLYVSFIPLVFRDGKYQKLVSFKLKVEGHPRGEKDMNKARKALITRSDENADSTATDSTATEKPATEESRRYASHSILATGQWAKISVENTGVHHLTEALVKQAGFSNINNVKIYGYGGALQPENLTGEYLTATDDLHEVPTYTTADGKRLFYAVGPVNWDSPTATTRTRNPYSNYGYYFLTESEGEPLTQDSATFVQSFYPSNNDYHSLYEVDNYAWYHSGRNLYDSRLLAEKGQNKYNLNANGTDGKLTVVLTSDGIGTVSVAVNDSVVGTVAFNSGLSSHDNAIVRTSTFDIEGLLVEENDVTLTQTSGTANMRLDYIALTMPEPAPLPDLEKTTIPTPKFVYRITNQDHHADSTADMVIIIPTSQAVIAEAQRLKTLHEEKDGMRVNIVPADELFNEFSSGTPDANAYRRYLKMLYDRAVTDADMPRYLLLFGDGAWDNRMLSDGWHTSSPDDFLLCYESENSVSATDSYVSDDYFCLLDDDEGGQLTKSDIPDVGAGRLPARTAAQAKVIVDKIISYRNNELAGDWQNVLCFMGDDGNNNIHMKEADEAAKLVERNYPGFNIKRVFWDAYVRSSTATGNYYYGVSTQVKNQMKYGALIMDYCGHGAPYSISHEKVLLLSDFATKTSLRLPLWVTASCDIMPYDSQDTNIGETAMLNDNGGCIAFYGTTRTVYTGANKDMNCGFVKNVLATVDGKRNTLGDAVRLTKGEVWGGGYTAYNKLHYTLLGDPALTLAAPTKQIVIDSINGKSPQEGVARLAVGSTVTVKGHVEGTEPFDGIVHLTMKDVEDTVVCRLNNRASDGAEEAYRYTDRPTTLYSGQDSLRNGQFNVTFALPRDVSYKDDTDMLLAYAVSKDRQTEAHGQNTQLAVTESLDLNDDGVGPSIYCYLNSSSFTNGDAVNSTPYFYAELSDKDGINVAGNGIGHDMELVIDGSMKKTYSLNDYFVYDFGDYRRGSVGFTIPELDVGDHSLTFRAWDVLNNSSLAELKFRVAKGLSPQCFGVDCTRNPATTSTSFIVSHDRAGSVIDVVLQVFDTSGRQLWEHAERGVSATGTYTMDWDLTIGSGNRLHTGVYLYRVLVGTDGSTTASEAKKLIILRK